VSTVTSSEQSFFSMICFGDIVLNHNDVRRGNRGDTSSCFLDDFELSIRGGTGHDHVAQQEND